MKKPLHTTKPMIDQDREPYLIGYARVTGVEAAAFLQAAQARMYFARVKCTVTVDQAVWVLGFARDTPYRLDATGRMAGWTRPN